MVNAPAVAPAEEGGLPAAPAAAAAAGAGGAPPGVAYVRVSPEEREAIERVRILAYLWAVCGFLMRFQRCDLEWWKQMKTSEIKGKTSLL